MSFENCCDEHAQRTPFWLVFIGFISSYFVFSYLIYSGESIYSKIWNILIGKIGCNVSKCCKSKSPKSYPLFINVDAINSSSYQNINITRICGYYKRTKHGYRSQFTLDGSFEIDKNHIMIVYNDVRKSWIFASENSHFEFAESKQPNEAMCLGHDDPNNDDRSVPLLVHANDSPIHTLFANQWNVVAFNEEAIESQSPAIEYFDLNDGEKVAVDDCNEATYIEFEDIPLFRETDINQHTFECTVKAGDLYRYTSTDDEELQMQRNGSDFKFFRQKSHLFWMTLDATVSTNCKLISWQLRNDDTDSITIDGSTKSYLWKQFIGLVLLSLCIYQWYFDISTFIKYLNTHDHESVWNKYQCYCYIASNSSNAKQGFIIFLFIMPRLRIILPTLPVHMRKATWLNVVAWAITCQIILLLLPGVFTHLIPFMAMYIWWLYVPACGLQCLFGLLLTCNSGIKCLCGLDILGHVESCVNTIHLNDTKKGVIMVGAAGFLYFLFLVFGVETMIRVYQGENYFVAASTTWNACKTYKILYRRLRTQVTHYLAFFMLDNIRVFS
eukprot:183384_1